ncbi:major facilitator superfamily transporter [Colletotrichum graminicola]|uniref:Major facilitator superfamily transporter n=1 Tax=Colletotrichum graminicola (strain M1.001 / M2 / FGSC 10212) TaxID=645133 RepID=E3QWA3_COLGM|nr:major facilitator superfamily transporter [Colletotrichum graminicola M1.001]EFQ35137.1 major facilitator superfamily transporter [Colletotrichum graminicola M1.001]WDK10464.1 major facilitator superfamily transporter [Colletotrichum graminicola]
MQTDTKATSGSDVERGSTVAGSISPETKEASTTVEQKSHPREGWASWRWPCVQTAFILGGMLLGYDVSNIANIQAPIYEAFGHVHLLPWVATGYTASQVCLVPLVRKLAFLGNVKLQLVVYNTIFLIGAAVSGSATSVDSIIIGRAVAGIGGAGSYQLTLLVNVLLSTPAEVPRFQGMMAVSWAIGLTLGPVIGGAFAENQNATWRWAMYLNLPILASIVLLIFVALPPIHVAPNISALASLLAIDWTGVVLHMAGFILLCFALIFSGSAWDWSSHSAIVAWVFVGVIYASYFLQQYFCLFTSKENRNIPADLLKSRTISLICLGTFAAGSCYGIALYYTPLFFAFTKGLEPVQAAVRLLPFIFTFIVFTIFMAGLIPVIGRYAPFYVVGGALAMIGGGLQSQLTAQSSEGRIMGVSILIGAGTRCMWQNGVAILTQSVPANRRLDATALFILVQLGGISTTIALAGCLFHNVGFNRLNASLSGLGYSEDDIREALAGQDSKIWAAADRRVAALAVSDVASVIANIQYIIVAAGALAFLSGCFMKWEKLDFGRTKAAK